MNRTSAALLLLGGLAASGVGVSAQPVRRGARSTQVTKRRPPETPEASVKTRPMSLEEARVTVRLLDDAYQTILTEVHGAYRRAPGRPVAASVVRELQNVMREKGWPDSHFVAVNALVMSPDHIARTPFDKQAVAALRHGTEPFETVTKGELRAATMVPLGGECFSCHWTDPGRAGRAAISWRIPLKPGAAP